MINSMTAFARLQDQGEWGMATWEIRSVNHRYLDVNLRLPELCRELEQTIRERIASKCQRGKVDCTLKFQIGEAILPDWKINQPLLSKLSQTLDTVKNASTIQTSLDPIKLISWPGVLQETMPDLTAAHRAVINLLDKTLDRLIEVRQREGAAIADMITQRLSAMEKPIKQVKQKLPECIQAQRDKLRVRLDEANVQVDHDRLEQELVIFATKMDVDEELDRLQTHMIAIEENVKSGGAVGRRLDFLLQECNREANTLASKSYDTTVTQAAVELKVLIEQMREQVQNIA